MVQTTIQKENNAQLEGHTPSKHLNNPKYKTRASGNEYGPE